MKQTKQIIGVIGGMGPQASNELYRLLIEGARVEYGARANDEYPEILIDSVPVPDGFSDPSQMEIVTRMLEDRTKRMTTYGATVITMACNTVCHYADRLSRNTHVNVISVVDEVVHIVSKRHSRVLLLASSTSLRLRLYQSRLEQNGVSFILPESRDYTELDSIISGVLAGVDKEVLIEKIGSLTERLIYNNHVEAIILGCTELPLIFPQKYHIPVYSSLSILAQTLLKRYYTKEVV